MQIMNHTIFDTPQLTRFLCRLSRLILRMLGWKIEGKAPDILKYVMIAAPHTSNWDFIFTLLIAFALELKIYMMGKKELLKLPWRPLFKWLAVIPIDRSQSQNTVAQAIQFFQKRAQLILVIPPAGTRKRVKKWKTGFYYIAYGANIPIALGFLDYAKKCGGIGPLVDPTGDIDADMIGIKAFYADIAGKIPQHEE